MLVTAWYLICLFIRSNVQIKCYITIATVVLHNIFPYVDSAPKISALRCNFDGPSVTA